MAADCSDDPWEYRNQLFLLEVLVDEVTVSPDAGYGGDLSPLSLSARMQFLDFPEMEVEPNQLVISNKQRAKQEIVESEIPGLPSEWEVTLASDLPDFSRFPQYRVRIPVKNPKPQKSYVVTVMVPKIAVAAGEGLRYTYTALEKNTEPAIMNVIKAQLVDKMEKDNKKVEEEPLFPVKFASGKSCLFRMCPVDLIKGLKKSPLYVMLYSNGIVDSAPVSLLVGKVRLVLGEPFVRAILDVEKAKVFPVSAHVEEMFQMQDIFGNNSGTVGLFVRLSCFGDSLSTSPTQGLIAEDKEPAEKKAVGSGIPSHVRPEALIADGDLSLGLDECVASSKPRLPVTWRRLGDKMPDVPKPKIAQLAPDLQPLPAPPPRVEPALDLGDLLPDLPRCTPYTPPPCYRRAGDRPLSRCEREVAAQLLREAGTKGMQTEPYVPTQRLPPLSPYLDRTAHLPPDTDPRAAPSGSQPPKQNTHQTPQNIALPQKPPTTAIGSLCTCIPPLQKEEPSPTFPYKTTQEKPVSKKPEGNISFLKGNDKANPKEPQETTTNKSKKEQIDDISDTDTGKESADNKSKHFDSNLKPLKKCTCQELTPEQKKLKQKPPPCSCKKRSKRNKFEASDSRYKKKECPECERIRLNGNLMRALQKITALEAEHNLTDSKVNLILQQEYRNKGDSYDFSEPVKGPNVVNFDRDKLTDEVREITAGEREEEMREAFKTIIEEEVTKFEERKKQKGGGQKSEPKTEKFTMQKKEVDTEDKKKRKRKKKRTKRTETDIEEIVKWMYPGNHFGHRYCLRPLRLVPKTMGWLWNISALSGVVKPGRGWRPGAVRTEVNDSIKQWRKERRARGDHLDEEEELAWGARAKRRQGTPKSPGSKKADSAKYNPTLHMHKKNGFYYISMYPIRSTSMDALGEEPKPAMFKINAKQSQDSGCSDSSVSSSDQESYEIEFITPTALRRQTKPPLRTAVSVQYLEDDFLPKSKRRKAELEAEAKKAEAEAKAKIDHKKEKRKSRGKGKSKAKKK